MKFTISWLKEHLDIDATLEEITDKLTALGLEVETVENPAAKYASFSVALIESAEKHPDADRLQVLSVKTKDETLQVVCGAPNARAGMKGIFAPVGSYIPGLDLKLKKGVIRGVESYGMMASERELCLSDEHEGVIELDDKWEIGTSMAEVFSLDDPVIDIALTPNRADCAGVRGIARDLAAAGMGTLKPLDENDVKGSYESEIKVHLDFEEQDKEACPLFIGRMIKNVKNGPSPEWMQHRLKAIGLRPISALVDITNYMSHDLCRPLHVFDSDKIKGDLHLRMAKKGEELLGLDGDTHKLDENMTAICDDSGIINLAGIMGGESTGCQDDTVNVYLEIAYFDPMRTAKTGRTLGLMSDARYRFERGVDPAFTISAAEIATRLILEMCGGEASEIVKAGDVPQWQRTIEFDAAHVKKMTGLETTEAEQKQILETLGFEIDGNWGVKPPSWRGDVEGKADLVEEISRVYGYDNIQPVSMKKCNAVTKSAETELMTRARKARTALADRGLNECVTWSFMSSELASEFGANDNQNSDSLKLLNPISSEWNQMRPSILPNLIDAASRNSDKGFPNNALFEIGPIFKTAKPDGHARVAAGIRSNAQGARHWSGQEADRTIDAFDAKADALAALDACGAPAENAQITRDAPEWYHPGCSGVLRLGKNILATFGEIHPSLLEEMNIKGPVVGFEVFLDNIPVAKKKAGSARKLLQLSQFQPVSRDFSFLIDEKTDIENIVRAARAADKNLITAIDVFDIYVGKGIEAGKKSVAINVILQPTEKTLTDAELEDISEKIVQNVSGKTGGQLRN